MEINIISHDYSKIKHEHNVYMVWAALLSIERVNCCGLPMDLLYIVDAYDKVNEETRFQMMANWLKNDTAAGEKGVNNNAATYKIIKQLRNKKHKNKTDIINLVKGEKLIKGMCEIYKNDLLQKCDEWKMSAFLPLLGYENSKPLYVFPLPDSDEGQKRQNTRFNIISRTITETDTLIMFDNMITDYFKSIEIENANDTVTKIDFISDYLYQLPFTFDLGTEHIYMIRNQMSGTQWKYFSVLEKLNKELVEINFAKENFNIITEKYTTHTSAVKPLLQKTIDDIEILSELSDAQKDNFSYKVYAGITSFENIIKMYRALEMITQEHELYIREDLSQKVSLNHSTVFLYLKSFPD